MKKIIVFPGKADGVFFKKEIKYLLEEFEQIFVLSYPFDITQTQEWINNSKIVVRVVKPHFLKSIVNIRFLKWLFSNEVRREARINCNISIQGIKRYIYLIYYGFFALSSVNIVKELECFLEKKDDIYIYSFWLSRGAYAGVKIKEYLNKKYNVCKTVSRAHRYDLYEERNSSGYLPFRRELIKNLNEIYFISQDGKHYFEKKYSVHDNCKLTVLRLGSKNENNLHKKKREKKQITIASCSAMIGVKRLDLIIDMLASWNVAWFWIHVGSGEKEKEIKEYALKRLPYDKYFFAGQVDGERILDVYDDYDIDFFVNLSDSEGVPVSIMEAISYGIPIIARNVGGNGEIVNAQNGYLIQEEDLGNWNEVERFVKKRLDTDEEYYQFSEEAFKFWRENYREDTNYKLFIERLLAK